MDKKNNILEKLIAILKKLLASNREITLAMITSIEGLPIVSLLPRGYDEKRLSAMIATMLSLSEKAVLDMKIGLFNQIFIKGIDGYILVFDVELAILAVSTTEKAKLGLIFLECERSSDEIKQILKRVN